MGAFMLKLEDFEAPTLDHPQADVKSDDDTYEKGFSDGVAATEAAFGRSDERNLEAISDTLSDLDMTYQEARMAVVQSLTPLIAEMCDRVLPDLCSKALAPLLGELVEQAATEASQSAVTVSVSAADFEKIRGQLEMPDDAALRVSPDPTLKEGQAVLKVDAQESFLDLSRVQDAINEALQSICDSTTTRTQNHG